MEEKAGREKPVQQIVPDSATTTIPSRMDHRSKESMKMRDNVGTIDERTPPTTSMLNVKWICVRAQKPMYNILEDVFPSARGTTVYVYPPVYRMNKYK